MKQSQVSEYVEHGIFTMRLEAMPPVDLSIHAIIEQSARRGLFPMRQDVGVLSLDKLYLNCF